MSRNIITAKIILRSPDKVLAENGKLQQKQFCNHLNIKMEQIPKADYLFEISWEVCNKVGGIFTVIASKASQAVKNYSENYYLIGPYFSNNDAGEFNPAYKIQAGFDTESHLKGQFEPEIPPENFKKVFDDFKKQGVECHFGTWLIKGKPKVILIDFGAFWPKLNDIKKELWEKYQIDSLRSEHDFNEVVLWSWLSGMVVEKLSDSLLGKKIVVQVHEWISGAALLYLKKAGSKVGAVFTTHATVLGRTLSSANKDLYFLFDKINADQEAYNYNIAAKHQMEKQSALSCDIFTAVSRITSMEAEKFLGRKPDVILPNGLEIDKFPDLEEVFLRHKIYENRMQEFLMFYFFPYYRFNVNNVLFYFTVGRYEFHNKGTDIFIKALGQLNKNLKSEKSEKTVVAFIWLPAAVKGIRKDVLQSKENYKDIVDYLNDFKGDVDENLVYFILSGKEIKKSELFGDEFLDEIKKKVLKLKRSGLPPLSTHELVDSNDIILRTLKEEGLGNKEEDRVKIVFYPAYLTGDDGLLNLDYYETIMASHLGVFASFYEPWGYTPLESAALGVCSVTSDLSGFGQYFKNTQKDRKSPGVYILERFGKNDEEASKSLLKILHDFYKLSAAEAVESRINARKMAANADWKNFFEYYIEAHNKAVKL